MPRARAPWLRALPGIAAVLPLVLPFVASLWITVGTLAGNRPFWPTPSLNLAEAAAVRDHAEVVRLLRAGADPNAAVTVRADLIDGEPQQLTPLEAAVSIRRLELVRLLVRHGARISAEDREALSARAKERGADDIVDYLARREP